MMDRGRGWLGQEWAVWREETLKDEVQMRFYLNSIKNPSPLKCDEQEGSYRQDMDSVGIYHEPAKTARVSDGRGGDEDR